jgi:glutaredoxin
MQSLVIAAVVAFGALVGFAEARAGTDAREPGSERAEAREIVMYVMPDCGYCERARAHLRARGVTWTERDIAASQEASDAFEAAGGIGTPLIVIGTERVQGYDAARIDALL